MRRRYAAQFVALVGFGLLQEPVEKFSVRPIEPKRFETRRAGRRRGISGYG